MAAAGGPRPLADQSSFLGEDPYRGSGGTNQHFFVEVSTVYTVVGVVKAHVVIRGHLCDPALHVFIRSRRQRHELPAFLFPIIPPAMRLLCERRSVEFLQVPPEVTVELLQAEIVHFLHVVKEALLQNADDIFNGTLVLRLPHLGRENHCVVVLRPFCVVFVQLRLDPVPVRNDSLLAVVANDQGRDTSKILQGVVVDLDPLRLLCGYHPFSVDVLGVRENGNEDYDLYDFSGEPFHQMKGFPGKVYFHFLANDGVKMQRLFVLLAPLGVILAELPVGIEFQPIVPAHLGIPVPENDQRHVLPG